MQYGAEQMDRKRWEEVQIDLGYNQVETARNYEDIAKTQKEVAKNQEEINKLHEIVQELQEKMRKTAHDKKERKKEIGSQKAELKRNAETMAEQQQQIEELKKQSSIEAKKLKQELKSLKNLAKEQQVKIENFERYQGKELERNKEELKKNTDTIATQQQAIKELKEQASIEAGKMTKESKSLKTQVKKQQESITILELLNARGRTRSKTELEEKGCDEKFGELEQKMVQLRTVLDVKMEENRLQHQRSKQAQEETEKRIQDFSAAPKEGQTDARVIKEEQDETKAERARAKMVVMGGIRQGGDEKEDRKIIQEKLKQLRIKQVVESNRLGKKHKFSKRPRNVVLTFENSAQAEEFLNRREEVVAQDGAIKMRKFRSENEMQEHRLKTWKKRKWRLEWTQSWRRFRYHGRHSRPN